MKKNPPHELLILPVADWESRQEFARQSVWQTGILEASERPVAY